MWMIRVLRSDICGVPALALRGETHLNLPFEQYHHSGRYLWTKRWKASASMWRENNSLTTA